MSPWIFREVRIRTMARERRLVEASPPAPMMSANEYEIFPHVTLLWSHSSIAFFPCICPRPRAVHHRSLWCGTGVLIYLPLHVIRDPSAGTIQSQPLPTNWYQLASLAWVRKCQSQYYPTIARVSREETLTAV